VVYVDNDPIVLAHAGPCSPATRGACAYIEADLHDPVKILDHPVTRSTLDFSQPIALMLVAVLHFVPDEDEPRRIISTLLDALPPGGYLVASHATDEHNQEGLAGAGRAYSDRGLRGALRGQEEFTQLAFDGLQVVEPGVVLVSDRRPEPGSLRPLASEVNTYGGVARKP
jgi:SAM-dependent methyltransferase